MKVIEAKAIRNFILYIEKLRFVINRLGREKKLKERKSISY